MTIDIRLVTRPEERLAVQRQRHAIYVEELGYANPHAVSGEQLITDELDDGGQILGAFVGSVLVGSVRVNFGQFGEYAELACVRGFSPYFPDRMMLITKLVIDSAYRTGTLMSRFGLALYLHCRDHHPHTCFGVISCVPGHVGLFQRLGYRQIGVPFRHPAAGVAIPMAVALYDLQHFRRIGCPVARLCPYHDAESSNWFARHLSQAFREDGACSRC